MGKAALLLAIAVFIGAGVLVFSTQRTVLETTGEQSLYQEELLAQQAARAGLSSSKSKVMRDFDNWTTGAYTSTAYQGGAFEVSTAGTPTGPAGPVKLAAQGSYGDYTYRAGMTLARLQSIEAPLIMDVDTLAFLAAAPNAWLEDTRPPSSMTLDGIAGMRLGNGPGYGTGARAVGYSTYAVDELQDDFPEASVVPSLRQKMEALYDQAESSPGRTIIAGVGAAAVTGTFGSLGNPEVVFVRPDSGVVADFSATQGYGMLVVEGSARMGTGFRWEGLVLVQADTTRDLSLIYTDDAEIYGALIVHHPNDPVAPMGTLGNFPPNTAWGVDDEGGKLRYFDLSDSTGTGTMSTIGDLLGVDDAPNGERDIEALTIAANGDIYFTNIEYESTLYKIVPTAIDPLNPAPVSAVLVGTITDSADGGTFNSGGERFSSLQFVGNTLYGMTNSTEELYAIDTQTAVATKIGDLSASSFTTDGMAMLDGVMYLTKTGVNPGHPTSFSNPSSTPSELWRFTGFPNDLTITQVSVMGNTGKVEALSSHPNGYLYCADDFHWYRVDPQTGQAEVIASHGGEVDIEGIDFYFPAEEGSHTGGVGLGEGRRRTTQVNLSGEAKIYYSTEAIGKLAASALGLTLLQEGTWIADFDHRGELTK